MLQFCVIMQKQYMSKIIGSSGRYCVLFILFQLYITKAGLFEDNFFFNLDSLHARLNSHYKAWSYKKKKHKRIKAHRKSG